MGRSRRRQALRDLKMQPPDPGLPELPDVAKPLGPCAVCGREIRPDQYWEETVFRDSTLIRRHLGCIAQDGPGE